MLSSHEPPRLHAHIDDHGLLTVHGLPDQAVPLVADHDEPANAYGELLNLTIELAERIGGQVWLHADTPTGLWGMAVHPDATTVPIPLEVFDTTTTESEPGAADTVADLDAALAAAGDLTPPPAGVVLALAADPATGVRAAATAELSTWADDDDQVIDADLSADQLDVLTDNRLGWVRAGVAGHPATSSETLTRLAGDPDPLVAQALAARLDLPAPVTIRLATHPDDLVRAELGHNPSAAFLLHQPTALTPEPARAATPADATATVGSEARGSVAVAARPTTADDVKGEHADRAHPGSAGPAGGEQVDTSRNREGRDLPDANHSRSSQGSVARGRVALAGGIAAVVVLAGGSAWAIRAGTGGAAPETVSASVPWHGTWLPSGPDGPSDPAAEVVSGFAHTQEGAALAAAHLSVRIDPYAGPAVFMATITDQTYGGTPAALLAQTQRAYQQAAAHAGISGGGPIPTSTGRITSWRIPDWPASGPVRVHLLVDVPDGSQVDFGIDVAWIDGDWKLLDPTASSTFTTSTPETPDAYRQF